MNDTKNATVNEATFTAEVEVTTVAPRRLRTGIKAGLVWYAFLCGHGGGGAPSENAVGGVRG